MQINPSVGVWEAFKRLCNIGWEECLCQVLVISRGDSLSTPHTNPAYERPANERWQIWRVLLTMNKTPVIRAYATSFNDEIVNLLTI